MHWPGGPNCSLPWAVRQENGNRSRRRTFCSHRPCEYRKQHAARVKCENRLRPASYTMHMPLSAAMQDQAAKPAGTGNKTRQSIHKKNGQGRETCRRTALTNGVTMLIITPCAHVKALRPMPPAERTLSAETLRMASVDSPVRMQAETADMPEPSTATPMAFEPGAPASSEGQETVSTVVQ